MPKNEMNQAFYDSGWMDLMPSPEPNRRPSSVWPGNSDEPLISKQDLAANRKKVENYWKTIQKNSKIIEEMKAKGVPTEEIIKHLTMPDAEPVGAMQNIGRFISDWTRMLGHEISSRDLAKPGATVDEAISKLSTEAGLYPTTDLYGIPREKVGLGQTAGSLIADYDPYADRITVDRGFIQDRINRTPKEDQRKALDFILGVVGHESRHRGDPLFQYGPQVNAALTARGLTKGGDIDAGKPPKYAHFARDYEGEQVPEEGRMLMDIWSKLTIPELNSQLDKQLTQELGPGYREALEAMMIDEEARDIKALMHGPQGKRPSVQTTGPMEAPPLFGEWY